MQWRRWELGRASIGRRFRSACGLWGLCARQFQTWTWWDLAWVCVMEISGDIEDSRTRSCLPLYWRERWFLDYEAPLRESAQAFCSCTSFLAAASHGVLDAMTDGGLGVAFFSPIDNSRYFFPWTPVRVAPIGVTRFFTARGWAVLQSELVWVWIPTGVVMIAAWMIRAWSTAE